MGSFYPSCQVSWIYYAKTEYESIISLTFIRKNPAYTTREGSKSSTHYLSDTNRFDVSSKGPSSGISVTLIPDEGSLLETSNLFVSLR